MINKSLSFSELRDALLVALSSPPDVQRQTLQYTLTHHANKEPVGLVNHFTIGADPEIMLQASSLVPPYSEKIIYAASLGLLTGVAFGADLSGRQVEIRPWASKSTLETVASIQVSLKWLSSWLTKINPNVKHTFLCYPFIEGDGLGGHIHFGKRNRSRDFYLEL